MAIRCVGILWFYNVSVLHCGVCKRVKNIMSEISCLRACLKLHALRALNLMQTLTSCIIGEVTFPIECLLSFKMDATLSLMASTSQQAPARLL